uniref:Uncharacterized protein n=1 Tax=viral metagenome TaxID=1070528 RepID=A0A2V0RL35_9ZZZZ
MTTKVENVEVLEEETVDDEALLTSVSAQYLGLGVFFNNTTLYVGDDVQSISLPMLELTDRLQDVAPFATPVAARLIRDVRETALGRAINFDLYFKRWFEINGMRCTGGQVFPENRPRVEVADLQGNLVFERDDGENIATAAFRNVPGNIMVHHDNISTKMPSTGYYAYKRDHDMRLTFGREKTISDGGKIRVIVEPALALTAHITKRVNGKQEKMISESEARRLLDQIPDQYDILPMYGTTNTSGIELGNSVTFDGSVYHGVFALRPKENTGVTPIKMFSGQAVMPHRIKLVCAYRRAGDRVTATRLITIIALDAVERVAVLNLPQFTTQEAEYERWKHIHLQGCVLSKSEMDLLSIRASITMRFSRVPICLVSAYGEVTHVPEIYTRFQVPGSSLKIAFDRNQDSYNIQRVAGIEIHDVLNTLNLYRKRHGQVAYEVLIDSGVRACTRHMLSLRSCQRMSLSVWRVFRTTYDLSCVTVLT